MNNDKAEPLPDTVDWLLAACDEALAAGATPPLAESVTAAPEMRARLERGVACIKLLREMLLPQQQTPRTSDAPGSGGTAPASQGRFQIRRELGHGAFGIVFLAQDPSYAATWP
jgi:hypothetical protein